MVVGTDDGKTVLGEQDGTAEGITVDSTDGEIVGKYDGTAEGITVNSTDGEIVGEQDGTTEGVVGKAVGLIEGSMVSALILQQVKVYFPRSLPLQQ